MVDHGGFLVLLVEDDPDHALLAHVAFSYVDASVRVHVAPSAEEAIAFLRGRWPDRDWGRAVLPDVIVLDLNMPGMGGLGFLEWYDQQDFLKEVPVVVLTSMGTELADRCMELGAKDYIVKTANFAALVERVRKILLGPAKEGDSAEDAG